MAMDLHTYAYSVTCIQETEIYVLDQRNYERLIEKRNPQVVDIIRNSVLEKYSLRMSWMQEKKDLPLFQYFLYKIAENDRKKILKKEDMIRKEKERESPEDWDVSSFQKGPLIDMFGPGSVFYSIRMKAKQREMDRLTDKARVDKRRLASDKSKKQTKSHTNSENQGPNFITQAFKAKYETEIGAPELSIEDDFGLVDGNPDTHRAHLVCAKGRHASNAAKEPIETDFNDWESSDANLCQLENRLQKWYSHFGEERPKKGDISIVKLRRYSEVIVLYSRKCFMVSVYHFKLCIRNKQVV